MTEQEQRGLIGLGQTVVSSLPAQFLVLVLITACFNLGLIWFLNQQDQARERLLGPIVTSCMQQVPGDVLKQLLERKP